MSLSIGRHSLTHCTLSAQHNSFRETLSTSPNFHWVSTLILKGPMRHLLFLATALFISMPAWSQTATFNVIKMSQGFKPSGDFNGDGRDDGIVFTQTPNAFHALVSTGTGSYTTTASYALPNNESEKVYAVGDFDNDGKLDVAIATSGQKLYVYKGTGDGKFSAPVTTSLPFVPSSMVPADVNHNGKMDLVLLNEPGGNSPSTVVSYFGNGSGGFSAGPASDFGFFFGIEGVGDFDGDGKADLLTVNCGPGGCGLTVYFGDGTGHFGSPTTGSANQGEFMVADVDGDGKSDIIGSTEGEINAPDEPWLTVFYGTATRTLQAGQIATSLCTFGVPTVADFNGDHVPDIIFAEHTCSTNSFTEPTASAQVAFLAGKGNRTFGSEQTLFNTTFQQSPGHDAAVLRANNGDSKPDFLFTQFVGAPGSQSETFIMVNTSAGAFAGCRQPNSATGFRICSPLSGASVTSPVRFSFGASWQVPLRKAELWVDGVKMFQSRYAFSDYAFLDTSLALAKGIHAITVVSAGWDNSVQSKRYNITVQ
jgi:hypothetical protein